MFLSNTTSIFFMETIFWFELVMLLLLDWEILKNPEGMLARWTSNLETCDNELVQRKALICRSHSSSLVAAKADKNLFISLISVSSMQKNMKYDHLVCQKSNWLDSWSHGFEEMQMTLFCQNQFL